jgi:predicted N-acetyltransferase YhbS
VILALNSAYNVFILQIEYKTGNQIDLDRMIELYRASTLGERRPVEDRERMCAMLNNANLVITAWDGELLVGIARSVTDFAYVTYLADLAVRLSHQRAGIGRELIRRTQDACTPQTRLVLLAAPKAVDYYPRVGFHRHEQCWQLEPGRKVL